MSGSRFGAASRATSGSPVVLIGTPQVGQRPEARATASSPVPQLPQNRVIVSPPRCPQLPPAASSCLQLPPAAPHAPLAQTCFETAFLRSMPHHTILGKTHQRVSTACLDLRPPPSAGSGAGGSPLGTAADQSQRGCPIWAEGVLSPGEVYEFCSKAACCVPDVISDRPSSWYGGMSQSRSRLG